MKWYYPDPEDPDENRYIVLLFLGPTGGDVRCVFYKTYQAAKEATERLVEEYGPGRAYVSKISSQYYLEVPPTPQEEKDDLDEALDTTPRTHLIQLSTGRGAVPFYVNPRHIVKMVNVAWYPPTEIWLEGHDSPVCVHEQAGEVLDKIAQAHASQGLHQV